MTKDYQQREKKNLAYKQHKFYKHLKTYLWFIGVMFFLRFFMHENIHFQPIAFWWGFVIVLDYVRTFGWENITNPMAQEPSTPRYNREDELEEDVFVELRPQQKTKVKTWREQDLV